MCVNSCTFRITAHKPDIMQIKTAIDGLFSPVARHRLGKIILYVAIISFFLHLLLFLTHNYLQPLQNVELLSNPVNAIYTPFSFLLVYEAYLLLFYLSRSTTIYVGKQYEIILLILIRSIFKDMTHLDLTQKGFLSENNLELWFDLGTVILLFGFILLFYRITNRFSPNTESITSKEAATTDIHKFVRSKTTLSGILLIISIGLGIYSFSGWMADLFLQHQWRSPLDINAIFFDQFFTLLIMSDVLILLFSLFYTDDFPIIIRNSSYVISTILLKLSFSAESGMAQLFILAGVGFGVGMSAITYLYSKQYSTGKPLR